MIYAEIRPDGTVHQVWDWFDEKSSPPILEDSTLVKFPDGTDVRPGMIWDGSQLLPPPPEPLEQVKERAKESVKQTADSYGRQLTTQYPESEMRSWPAKEAAARAYVAGTATQEQKNIIETEANYLGVQSEDLARSVVAKADFFLEVAATMAGLRGKAYNLIDAAQSAEEVEQILQQMSEEAQAAWDDLMSRAPWLASQNRSSSE